MGTIVTEKKSLENRLAAMDAENVVAKENMEKMK